MESLGEDKKGLWDEEDGFFYDVLQLNDGTGISLKLRSIVGLIPMFCGRSCRTRYARKNAKIQS